MKCNIGTVEKTVRLLLALPMALIGILMYRAERTEGLFLITLAVWLLCTALFRWCPLRRIVFRETPPEQA